MRLRATPTKPITKVAMRVLIEIHNVRHATDDREIAGAGTTNASVARRRPTEQVLRPNVAAISPEARTQTDRLVNFVFRRTLSVEVACGGRPAEPLCRRRNAGSARGHLPAPPK